MKRSLILLFSFAFILSAAVDGKQPARMHRKTKASRSKPKATPCPGVFEISDCPAEGCGKGIDPELNKRKNIRSDDGAATLKSVEWMKTNLPDPSPKADFCADEIRDRTKLKESEGQKITVMAWALAARSGSQESCNCKLSLSQDTDNHIVLVQPKPKEG